MGADIRCLMMRLISKLALLAAGAAVAFLIAGAVGASHSLLALDEGSEDAPIMVGGYHVLFNQYKLPDETVTIGAVEVNFPNNLRGYLTDVLLYADTDLTPDDAVLIYRDEGRPPKVPSEPHVYAIDPPLTVSGGYLLAGVAIKDRATWCDEGVSGTQSWMAYENSTAPFNPEDLSFPDNVLTLDGRNPFGYNCTWHIRVYTSLGESPDLDGDGFNDGAEILFGTDPHDACADDPDDDAWPLDMNNDSAVGIADVLALKPVIFTDERDERFSPRFDLNLDHEIDISDVLMFKPALFTSCS